MHTVVVAARKLLWRRTKPHARITTAAAALPPWFCRPPRRHQLKDGILSFLGLPPAADAKPSVAAIAERVARWDDGAALEDAMQRAGLAATKCRTPAEWRASPQGQIVATLPPVVIEPHASAAASADASSATPPRLLKAGSK